MTRGRAVHGRAPWTVLPVVAALALAAVWWWQARGLAPGPAMSAVTARPEGASITTAPSVPTPAAAAAPLAPGPPLSALGQAQRRQQLALWQGRLERSRQALEAYRISATYPHGSRPIEEHPDQVRPFDPIAEDRALRMPGGSAPRGVRLQTTQERVFASGMESSRITLRLTDEAGRALPLRVTRAVMHEVTPPGRTAATAEVAVPANDAGRYGDAVAGDGTITAVMQPATQGFGTWAGTVRLELDLDHAGQPGFIYFDLVYSPETAATWLPGVREAMEDGSLALYLKAQVLLPGRYVVTGRIDDAAGQPLALAQFNGEVAAGTVEFRLPVFGRLVRERKPPMPLVLRDVEAFLLKPDAFPDRVMLPRLAGVVHTSKAWPLAGFSEAEWQSDEKSRYLTELGKDVAEAERQVRLLAP